ncbi:hypothetical protein Vretimale_12223 [Volvox reticuliferus]|uniref:Uncharacterized protein n=1 Tax=Volvox reticuliferus TaxID=1737510 RepID=A0A8J4CBE7_9CHLO|nr:hypothetical protein Vretifemale_8859 [Volvox reticuliferus]GIM08157.1 hypothetical protein Vretimale_12223 [Volvox reticuliferus]
MPDSDLAERYDVEQTIDYIVNGGYRSVALQFPDEQLRDSPAVSQLLQRGLGDRAKVFILADTAYNPLGVDEVAAQHLAAQCVVHYGRASVDPVTSIPAFFVFPKDPLNVPETVAAVRQAVSEAVRARCAAAAPASSAGSGVAGSRSSSSFSAVVVLIDQGYQYRLEDLNRELLHGGMPGPREAGEGGNAGNACHESGGKDMQDGALPAQPPWIFANVAAKSLSPKQMAPHQHPPPQPALRPAARGGCCGAAANASRTTAAASTSAAAITTTGCCRGGAAAATATAQEAADACLGVMQERALAATPAAGGGEERIGGGDGSCCAVTCASGSIQQDGCGTGLAGARVARGGGGHVGATVDAAQAAPGMAIATLQADTAESYSAAESEAAARAGPDADSSSGGGGSSTPCTCRMVGLCWSLPPGVSRRDCLYVWVGPYGSSAHQVLQLTHSTCEWLSYDPAEGGGAARQGLSDDTRRLLKRRNFLVEKVRSASIIGLLVGTLGSAGFLDVILALRRLAIAAGKKTYTFLMGKPNPAKLGNFPEVDVFVMVCDAQGLILDCRDYLAPLVSPWEAAIALLGHHLDPDDYRMEMRDVLELEAQYRQQPRQETEAEGTGMALQALGNLGLSVATRGTGGEVVARTAAEFLTLKRTFKGLEMPATGAFPKAPELAVEGLSGRAAVYSEEGSSQRAGAGEPDGGSKAAGAW